MTANFDLVEVPLGALMEQASAIAHRARGGLVTYSRKVFIPLTRLCRDVCHYCAFATAPRALPAPYLTVEQAIAIAREGAAAGCKEALFTLGDRPEARYPAARRSLEQMGFASTLDYLGHVAAAVHRETGLLPHLNPGVMTDPEIRSLRPHAASMGIMLESVADRLCQPDAPHHGSPDKIPAKRLATLAALGRQRVSTTTGLLIGIGETRAETVEGLEAIVGLHAEHGHIQEVIVQNFRAKAGTRMALAPHATLDEHLWAIAAARIILPGEVRVQAPPNLRPGVLAQLLRAGVDDWGGVSPVTPDHVNPEAPWPKLARLKSETAAAGRTLIERLAIGPDQARDADRWTDPAMARSIRRAADGFGLARSGKWYAGRGDPAPGPVVLSRFERPLPSVAKTLARATGGEDLAATEIASLFEGGDADFEAVRAAADLRRDQLVGPTVTYVGNRNINYTNICTFACGFCAFSKGSTRGERGPAYRLDLAEIGRRAGEAALLGASEVCLQGGIHPNFTGQTYLEVVATVKDAAPSLHIHAFSPLEVQHGARTLGLSLGGYLARLKEAGLASLPGTAAEILDDEIRAIICPDKLSTIEWLEVMRAAHRVGLRSTATIMFGHVDGPLNWARHLLRVKALQDETGGFTEFVPLPFVHMEAPIWKRGRARSGPTWREAILMHAIARLVLAPSIPNIQASWVKLGADGAAAALQAGANDLGGTLINESITRAAGGRNGQHRDAAALLKIADAAGRPLRRRTTVYGDIGRVLAAG